MSRILLVSACILVSLSGPASAAGNLLFILDASGSMRAKVDGTPKIDIAKSTLGKLIGDLPPDTKVGLMAYGHRENSSCTDVETLLAVGHATPAAVSAKLAQIEPKGKTPIAYALKQAAADFVGFESGPNNIVLISDGIETCGGDPCAVAGKLAKSNVNVRVNVVGFTISQKDRKQLECIARLGKGRYFSADSTNGFVKAVTKVVKVAQAAPAPAPKPAPAVYFSDEFPGSDLAPHWAVANANTDAYLVEDGHLLLVAGAKGGFNDDNTPNIVTLKNAVPHGDWKLTAKIKTSYQTGKENFWIGLRHDAKNYIAAKLYPIANNLFGHRLQLEIEKVAHGKVKKLTKTVRHWSCNVCDKNHQWPNFAATLGSEMALSLVRHGRQYKAALTILAKGKTPEASETGELTSLRAPGGVAMTAAQNDKTSGETTYYVESVKIVAAGQ